MKDVLTVIGAIVFLAMVFFLAPLIGVVFGAFSGWVVSIFAPNWVTTGLGLLGFQVRPDQLVELGAALGFVGGFFKSYLQTKKAD
jgi:hypothetical protein